MFSTSFSKSVNLKWVLIVWKEKVTVLFLVRIQNKDVVACCVCYRMHDDLIKILSEVQINLFVLIFFFFFCENFSYLL